MARATWASSRASSASRSSPVSMARLARASVRTTAPENYRRHRKCRLVPPGELAAAIPRRRRAGQHRVILQIAVHVRRQGAGGLVAAVAVLLQALHHDPVQLPAEQLAQPPRIALAL